jgi:glycosyltransferase involved in cell wall biosynthesis
VEKLILDGVGRETSVEHVATMTDGGRLERLLVFLAAVRRIRILLRGPQPLVFHVHFASRGSTLRKYVLSNLVLRSRHRLILHAHGAEFDLFFQGLPTFLRRKVIILIQRADGFIALSSQWRHFYATTLGRPPERVTLLVNPIKVPKVLPERGNHETVQFLFLGRIGARKGTADLLEAFSMLPAKARVRARLVFAGDGEVEDLRRRAEKVGPDVTVQAWVNDEERNQLLARSDVLVLPSRGEGMPMAVLEAMAWGLAVIATPVGGIPDVVKNRQEGLLIEVGDRQGLSSAMAELVADPQLCRRLGAQARMRAKSLDVVRYTEQLLALYESVRAQGATTNDGSPRS